MSDTETAPAPRFLLLLPPIPKSASDQDLLSSVYGETIREVLAEVQLASIEVPDSPAAVLELALACPHLLGSGSAAAKPEPLTISPRYAETLTALSTLYRLIGVISAKEGINVEDSDGVDVRVLLVAWDQSPASEGAAVADSVSRPLIASLRDLAASGREWQYAFGVESDEGAALVKAFVVAKHALASATPDADPVPQQGNPAKQPQESQHPTRRCVAVGGTFDHLHIGHKLLLTLTLFAAVDSRPAHPELIVGITGDALLTAKQHPSELQSWPSRQRAALAFLAAIADFTTTPPVSSEVSPSASRAVTTRFAHALVVRCVEIADPFGPTVTEADIDALVVSAETRAGGAAVNAKRAEQGWARLEVLEVGVLDGGGAGGEGEGEFAAKISSTAIRRRLGEKKRGR